MFKLTKAFSCFNFNSNKNKNPKKKTKLVANTACSHSISGGKANSYIGFDTHANISLVNNSEYLHDLKPISNFSIDGLGASIKAKGIGNLFIKCQTLSGKTKNFVLPNVLYCPDSSQEALLCSVSFCELDGIDKFVLPRVGKPYVLLDDKEKLKCSKSKILISLKAELLKLP